MVDDRLPCGAGNRCGDRRTTSLALITTYFDGEARNRAIAWYAVTAGIGASLGLLVGGALTEWVSWRAAFLVNVPIAVALIAWSGTVLVETPRRTGQFDVIGALAATLGMGAVIFGIIESADAGWGSAGCRLLWSSGWSCWLR